MSTDYFIEDLGYIQSGELENTKGLHIGTAYDKAVFNLRIYPEFGLNDLGDWIDFLENKNIISEAKVYLTSEGMLNIISHIPIAEIDYAACVRYNGIWYRKIHSWFESIF